MTVLADLKRTIVSLNPEQHEWLRTRAFHERLSMAEIVRRLIEDARGQEGSKRQVK
jgi:hypothetical protein